MTFESFLMKLNRNSANRIFLKSSRELSKKSKIGCKNKRLPSVSPRSARCSVQCASDTGFARGVCFQRGFASARLGSQRAKLFLKRKNTVFEMTKVTNASGTNRTHRI